jgi:hypothetical protein
MHAPSLFRFALPALFLAVSVGALRGDDQQATTESRLRDALRNSMLQLRDAQNQVVTLQATQAQSDKDNADLKTKVDAFNAQIDALNKQSSDDKAAAAKVADGLNAQIADQTGQIAKLNEALAEWKTAYNQATQLAATKESERARLAQVAISLHRQVEDLQAKNLKLFATGTEILQRYEEFSLGEALGAKEPFTGITKVKLSEQVQDYKDQLLDQRLLAPQDAPLPPPPGSPASPSPRVCSAAGAGTSMQATFPGSSIPGVKSLGSDSPGGASPTGSVPPNPGITEP